MTSWCRRVVEAGGLAVAILLPLYFNPFAAAPFEPAKVRLFLAIVGGMLVVGAGCRLAAWGRWQGLQAVRWRVPPGPERPIVLAALAYAGAFLLATLASADPWGSFWGHGPNPHGAVTVLALVAFFLLMVRALCAQGQVERVVTALLLGTVPAATYGLVQYLHLDPLRWIQVAGSPVHSTMGNTIYLGAYLAMAAPFTLSRVATAPGRGQAMRYGLILALQLACLFLTRARGAWLGLIAASLLFLGYLAWSRRSRVLALTCLLVATAGVALLPAISVVPTGAASGRAEGLTSSVPPAQANYRTASVYARLAIWQGTLRLVPARWLLGYGPDGFTEAFAGHVPGRWDRYLQPARIVDDPHNILLEHLVSAGVLGLGALLAVLGAFSLLVLRALKCRGPDGPTLAAVAASAVAFLVSAQLSPDVIALSALFWLDLALGVAAARLSGLPRAAEMPRGADVPPGPAPSRAGATS